jgi:hypothetical protein
VTRAVQFDVQSRFITVEIQDVPTNRMLAPEFVAGKSTTPQPSPQKAFGPGATLTQVSGECHLLAVRHRAEGLCTRTQNSGKTRVMRDQEDTP